MQIDAELSTLLAETKEQRKRLKALPSKPAMQDFVVALDCIILRLEALCAKV